MFADLPLVILYWLTQDRRSTASTILFIRIIIGSDRRPETKQGIEEKIVKGRITDRVGVRDKDRRSEAISFGAC